MENSESRSRVIIRTSIIGILANLILAGFKAAVGIISGSIAIVLDAVNNLSDAASSVITAVGTRLAAKEPDKKHPFGYGRIEYLTAMIISILVLYAGITSLVESVKKIIQPETPDYSLPALIIVGAAVAVKIVLGLYTRSVGKKVNSDSLINSGEDATLDSVISASTLAAAIFFIFTKISLEAWLGAVISLVIIKSGIGMLRETLSRILGERAEPELARAIRDTAASFPNVAGAHDLVLHNYGPDAYTGSVHVEVPQSLTAADLDELQRAMSVEIYKKHGVIMTAVGVYAVQADEESAALRDLVTKTAMAHGNVLEVHGFYLDKKTKTARFDLVVSFDEKDRRALADKVVGELTALRPEYAYRCALDTDFADI